LRRFIISGLIFAVALAGCGGEAAATVDSVTREFCEGITDILEKPADEWGAEITKLGESLDKKVQDAGLSEDALSEAVGESCGDELIRAAGG
jgi:hypothetical protein